MVKVLTCGFVVTDIIAVDLPKFPAPGDHVFAPHGIRLWIGGHPANISVDLRQLGMGEGEVAVAAAIGPDILGDFIEGFLRSKGVITFLQRVNEVETGKALVLVLRGRDRGFIADPGANSRLSHEHVIEVVEKLRPKIFYLACGILGEFDFKVSDIFKLCHEYGALTMLDVVKPFGKGWNFIEPALKYVDITHSNVEELRGLSGEGGKKGLLHMAKKGVKLPIVSDGPSGLTALFRGKYIRQPAFRVDVVDPTGAGDALCAGIIRKLIEHLTPGGTLEDLGFDEILEILLYGQAAGAACVGAIGTTAGVTAEKVEHLLRDQGMDVLSRTSIEHQQFCLTAMRPTGYKFMNSEFPRVIRIVKAHAF